MEISQLEAFIAVANTGSFSKASGTLHLSQPAISRRIAMLEHALNTSLFERMPKGIILSDSGKIFLPYAMRVMSSIKDGMEALKTDDNITSGRINIAIVGTLASTNLSQKLKAFRAKYPQVELNLRTALSDEVSDLVLSGEVHLGMRYFPDNNPDIQSNLLLKEPMVTVCANDTVLFDRSDFNIAKLESCKFLSFAKGKKKTTSSFYQITQKQLIKAGLDEIEMMPVDSLTAQKRLVEVDFGLSLLPLSCIDEELKLGSLSIIDHPLLSTHIEIFLIHRKTLHLNKVLENFIQQMA